ncbi:MAG: hypothetical protein JW953_01875 [Anaerolineae bacterium]|nr:hypothetical protein [Anaerolineae bacterium]
MARKRASLKDKGPETLGLTQKKGKGIDVLFGGPPEQPAETKSPSPAAVKAQPQAAPPASPPKPEPAMIEDENDLSDLAAEISVQPPPAPTILPTGPESLPVNEADDEAEVTSSEDVVDELGLPVAMEAPPPDLELATPLAEPMPEPAKVAPPPSTPETPPAVEVPPSLPPLNLPVAQPAPAPAPTTPPAAIAETDDLSGLAAEDDLSGLAEAEAAPAPPTVPPANLPPGPPPLTADPTKVRPPQPVTPASSGAYMPRPSPSPAPYRPPTPPTTYTARPSALGTPPSTATGAPSLSMPRAKIESFGGIVGEAREVKKQDIQPEDTKVTPSDNIIDVQERSQFEKDEEISRRVTRYIGQDRREKLDQDIMQLYNEVAAELSVNKEDAEFALKILSQAQDIILEDPRQYDEALYRVAIVRTMIARKRNLRRWSYTWGSFVFFYAVVWLVAFIAGFLLDAQLQNFITETNAQVDAVRAAWFSALAGGIGGVIGILYSLYWHVAMKQDFDRQYVMYYLVQPVMGFVLGSVIYFIIEAGFLVFGGQGLVGTRMVVALQVLLGWIAGFRQRFVFEMIDKIVQRVSPKPKGEEETKKPVSLIPSEERERIEGRLEQKTGLSAPETKPPTPAAPVEGQAG